MPRKGLSGSSVHPKEKIGQERRAGNETETDAEAVEFYLLASRFFPYTTQDWVVTAQSGLGSDPPSFHLKQDAPYRPI